MVLMSNTYYNFTFENGEQITNISYDSVMSGFDVSSPWGDKIYCLK